ncbi:MAG TPA: signal peptidase II [Gammaproteobacteria bacterium]
MIEAVIKDTRYARRWLLLSVAVILVDQFTKWLAEASLVPYQPVPVVPMFNLTLAYNTGAAFSFLSDAGGWQRWFFISLTLVVIVVLFSWLWRMRAEEKLHAMSISMILGGAIGNLIDRVWLGHVIDFLDVYYDVHHWPIFNIADSAITIGVILLIVDLFIHDEKRASEDG